MKTKNEHVFHITEKKQTSWRKEIAEGLESFELLAN